MGKGANDMTFCEQLNKADAQDSKHPPEPTS